MLKFGVCICFCVCVVPLCVRMCVSLCVSGCLCVFTEKLRHTAACCSKEHSPQRASMLTAKDLERLRRQACVCAGLGRNGTSASRNREEGIFEERKKKKTWEKAGSGDSTRLVLCGDMRGEEELTCEDPTWEGGTKDRQATSATFSAVSQPALTMLLKQNEPH